MSKKFRHDTINLEASGRIYLFDLDYYYKLNGEYDVTDRLKLSLGYECYFGEPDGVFGQYNRNDQYYAKLKCSF